MRPHCARCGKPCTPAAYIGDQPIGPDCARRMNLSKRNPPPKGGLFRLASPPAERKPRQPIPTTGDLFADQP